MAYVRLTLETDDETRYEQEIHEKYSNMRKAVNQLAEMAHEWIRQTFPEPVLDVWSSDPMHGINAEGPPVARMSEPTVSYAHGSPVRNDVPAWNELVGCDECTAVAMCRKHAKHAVETDFTRRQHAPDATNLVHDGWYVADPGLPLVPQPGEPCRFCGCTVEGGSGLCFHETGPDLVDWRGMVLNLRRENAAMRARMMEAMA